MTIPPSAQRILEKCAFDVVKANDAARVKCLTMLRDMISRGTAQQYGRELMEQENARLLPIITALLEDRERLKAALESLNEHTSTHLEDMEHYFDNKCCPTVQEVNACAVADSQVRCALAASAEVDEALGGGEELAKDAEIKRWWEEFVKAVRPELVETKEDFKD